ncbi:MAG: helix-turn-helix transcriptional regulator [Bacteroidales bacterium]|nr:helix-turn-helix transcriptional regulator [Bacteroidales bacterium]
MPILLYQVLLLLVTATAVFFIIMFVQSRKAYKRLLKKNLEEQQASFTFSDKIDFLEVKADNNADQDLIVQLKTMFEVDKVYIDPDLSLNQLAKKMGTNRATLSHVINQYFHKSFPALLNQYRVNEALRLLTEKSSKDYKLEVIGEMCGYRNRQVFHSAFKRETGITPNHFRKISEE